MPQVNTTPQQILDIEDALVSDENPARDGALDYERCARLHNYLVAYGWMARHERDTPDLDALASEEWFFQEAEEDIAAIRSRLITPLNSFLDSIYDPNPDFFYWVNRLEMMLCDEYFIYDDNSEMEEDKERFVLIYGTQCGLGSHNLGVIYDQQRHLASFPMTIENSDSVEPVDEHEEMWFPLETILTHWIYMLRIGKIVAGFPEGSLCGDTGLPTNRSQFGIWSWLPYCDLQVESTIAAMERYSAVVESRMSPDSLLPMSSCTPLFTDTELDAAGVPRDCFIRTFLTRVKTPRFTFIAPGLEVPHDKEGFIRRQTFTNMGIPLEKDCIPGVLIFAAPDRLVNVNHEIHGLFSVAHEDLKLGNPIPTGLYSEPVRRSNYDMEEAGFHIVLPFGLRRARMSDYRLVTDGIFEYTKGSFTNLFQHGYFHSFGGERRAQRLENLFDRWKVMVESGIWTVGENGVEGGIDKFREADRDDGLEYSIAPSW
ncbi:hypothetical protein N7481_008838 [Penicillium waksmanii]|uniref:uncharacterized protein n=1 Tax=Penicillium waksmanii TaxID=69791 RepID=UPI002548C3F7|nr:uncharacterized protein N7481_008838 [Penicillium waksmanii]KAJ5975131.1 hypothetical protein N7481_008838 [Penicillium waksmanii]